MREQVITPRAGRGGRGGVPAQRPAARRPRSAEKAHAGGGAWRRALGLAPLAAKALLAAALGVLFFAGYRAAASASFFEVKTVDVEGASRASREEIRAAVLRVAGPSGVWRADLGAVSRELRGLPWVRSVVVSRVLPSGLRVRVTERAPALVALTASGRLVWADDEGVMLGAAAPAENDFIVRGLEEANSEEARARNRERVRVALDLKRQWGPAGLGRRVSEVNLDDLRDVRVQLAGDDARIEVRLGREAYAERLRKALEKLDEYRQAAGDRPAVTYIDMTTGRHAILGRSAAERPGPDAVRANAPAGVAPPKPAPPPAPATAEASPAAARQPSRAEAKKRGAARPAAAREAAPPGREKKKRDERGTTPARADEATRPRRVGRGQ